MASGLFHEAAGAWPLPARAAPVPFGFRYQAQQLEVLAWVSFAEGKEKKG
jgi:hypothetical protein